MATTKIVAASAIVATATAFAPTGSFQPRLRSTGVTGVTMKQFPFDSKVAKAIGNAVPLPPPSNVGSYAFTTGGGSSSSSSSSSASAKRSGGGRPNKSGSAPVITVFDHRGCQRGGPNKEYSGAKTNGPDDEMCVKVQTQKIKISEKAAGALLQEVFGSLMTKK